MPKAQSGCEFIDFMSGSGRRGFFFSQPEIFAALWFGIINIWEELKGSWGRKARSEV